MPVETKLNTQNPHHQLLISLFATFVEDYGYHPRELYELIDHTKNQTYFALQELHEEVNR
ncbi:MAG: hypothetical protein ABS938_15830 [Psychrobacillus psychrodurans]